MLRSMACMQIATHAYAWCTRAHGTWFVRLGVAGPARRHASASTSVLLTTNAALVTRNGVTGCRRTSMLMT